MAFEGLRERWEQMAPRERRLGILLGVALVVSVFGFIGLQIRSGLKDLEAKNGETRYALGVIDEHANDVAVIDNRPEIPVSAQPLATYLETIATEVGVTIPEQTEKPAQTRGKFTELSIDIRMRGISLDQLARFLKLVETRSPVVITQRLYIKPYVSAHEKLDVDLTIATFEQAKKLKPGKGEAKATDGDDADKSGG